MSDLDQSLGHKIGQAALASAAVIMVCLLVGLAFVVTLVLAPPLKAMAERNQAP